MLAFLTTPQSEGAIVVPLLQLQYGSSRQHTDREMGHKPEKRKDHMRSNEF